MSSKKTIGKTLKMIRDFHHLKQKQVAYGVGVSPSHICDIENGKNNVTIDLLMRLGAFFNMYPSFILLLAESLEAEKVVDWKAQQELLWIFKGATENDPKDN